MSSVKVVNVKFLVHQTCRVAKAVKIEKDTSKQKGMYIRVYSTPLYCVILAKNIWAFWRPANRVNESGPTK